MAFKYHIVEKKDMRMDAEDDDTLFYGQIRAGQVISYRHLCESICAMSTTFRGDVGVVVKGIIHILRQNLAQGRTVYLDGFGSFRMVCGSSGVKNKEDFHPKLFKKPRIVFSPGVMLRDVMKGVHFEKLGVVYLEAPEETKE